MKQIYVQNEIIDRLIDKQTVDKSKKYKRFLYLAETPTEGGVLILNTLTYEFIFLTNEESELLNSPDFNNSLTLYLIEQYFLVTEDFDEKKFAKQVIDARLQIQSAYRKVPYSTFVILTTTGCNARCFYCFEQGAKPVNMTEMTAYDVADFIIKKGKKKVNITWFGGEPLINAKVMDIISNKLIENKISFTSRMASNGYLLNDEMIHKAIYLWHLNNIQITLDGTEKVYNKIKDYVYTDGESPFLRVLRNIEKALKANIYVNIRLNLDAHNSEDLYELSQMLVERFNKYKNCYIYVVRLYENISDELKNRSAEERHKVIESSVNLQSYISANMPKPPMPKLPKFFESPNTCMACGDGSIMILPDGHLGKCEHFIDSEFIGSIYEDEIDVEKVMEFKERVIVSPDCENCNFRSLCIPLKRCSGTPDHCDEIDKKAIAARLYSKMHNIYNQFLVEQGEEQA